MTAIAILNIVLVVVVTAGIVSMLGWSIVTDKVRVTSRTSREPSRAPGRTAGATLQHRGPARSSTA